jgi:hypothetical protein
MANEINLQAVFTVQRYTPALQGVGNININQTGTRCVARVVNVTTSANLTLQIDGTTQFAYVFVKNLDTTAWSQSNYVHVALDNTSPPAQIIAKLRAGEFCLIPVKEATSLYARAFGINADILFCAAQG